jgi:hypothetical protein
MTRRHLASPLYGTRTLAGTDKENLQTQSPWNPVRLKQPDRRRNGLTDDYRNRRPHPAITSVDRRHEREATRTLSEAAV